jgi:hypothetical protein
VSVTETPTRAPVLSHTTGTNADLIVRARQLGHLTDDGTTWDGTYGEGTFWKRWRPWHLVATDLDPAKSPNAAAGLDATDSRLMPLSFAHVVLDPPYKLNGTDQGEGARYGVAGGYASVEARHDLMRAMLAEGWRVLAPGGTLLYKCQDQANAGAKVWQTDLVTGWATELGLVKIDALQLESYRPQPERSTCSLCGAKIMRRADGRWGTVSRKPGANVFACSGVTIHVPDPDDNGQALSHANFSTLLVFRKPVAP